MIYLDHAATSPMLPEVVHAITPWLGVAANPSSAHRAGQRAASAVDRARAQVAALVGGRPEGVVFTSGATEANHLHLLGVARRTVQPGSPLVISAVEHPSVMGAAAQVAALGHPVCVLPVGGDGALDLTDLPSAPLLVAVMAVNHETGVRHDLAAVAAAAGGAPLHVDATQAAPALSVTVPARGAVVISGHKLGGPSGVGALILGGEQDLPAMLEGGGQERGRRAGTTNVVGVVGLGEACALALQRRDDRAHRWAGLAGRLRAGLVALGAQEVADASLRSPGITSVVFPGVPGDGVVQALDLAGICVSHGAACASGSTSASPVLTAMGHPEPGGVVRFSFGDSTAASDVDGALAAVARWVTASQVTW